MRCWNDTVRSKEWSISGCGRNNLLLSKVVPDNLQCFDVVCKLLAIAHGEDLEHRAFIEDWDLDENFHERLLGSLPTERNLHCSVVYLTIVLKVL